MKLFYLLVFIIALSSCSKTSEFSIPTSAYFTLQEIKDTAFHDTIVVDSIPTNFAYSLQANQTSSSNVKQVRIQEIDLRIINNSYSQNFNFIDTLKFFLYKGEDKPLQVAQYVAPKTPAYLSTLQVSSDTTISGLINYDFFNLKIVATCIDTIPVDIQVQANVLFYVKAKTD